MDARSKTGRSRARGEVVGEGEERFERKRAPYTAPKKRKKPPMVELTAPAPDEAANKALVPFVQPPQDKLTKEARAKIERAQQLVQDVFVESLETLQDQLTAFDLDPNEPDKVPEHWPAELPDAIAVKRRLRIAQAGLLTKRDAPVALEAARAVVQNTLRAQAKQSNVFNVKRLNVAVVIGGTKHDYPEMEITAHGEKSWEEK